MTITLTREEAQQVERYIRPGAIVPVDMETTRLLVNALRARITQPEPEREQGDMPCIEDDGCPTEKAVLQRFWRKHWQPEPEPVAWWHDMGDVVDLNVSGRGVPLYTTPPQREWQGLTEDDALQLLPVMPYEYEVDVEMILEFASAIEVKLKEKNGG